MSEPKASRCFLFHNWTKWEDTAKGSIYEKNNMDLPAGYFIKQERRCLNCGKVQVRTAET